MILFGEHAVVSGAPALGAAVDLRVRARIEDLPGRLEVSVPDMRVTAEGFAISPISGDLLTEGVRDRAIFAARYITAVLREFGAKDLRITVESELPPASGLGSSASVVVATLGSLSRHLGLDLSRDEIAEEAYRIEKSVQEGLGSPLDTALATFGGYQFVEGSAESIDLPEMMLVVGYTGRPHDTRAEVEKVQRFRSGYPEVVDPIFRAMGEISRRAPECIRGGRLQELGALFDASHGLLEAIGVGTRELSELVYASRGAGRAFGAKLTGAGGGGCMIALPRTDPEDVLRVMTAITQARGFPFSVVTGCQGLRLEYPGEEI
ncbi:MAG: mevalonate kinase [Methanothrix sp.]